MTGESQMPSDYDAARVFAGAFTAWAKPVDRRVFEALLVRCAQDARGGVFRASVREVAAIARVSGCQHVRAALRRLSSAQPADGYATPLIERVDVPGEMASSWRFAPGVVNVANVRNVPTSPYGTKHAYIVGTFRTNENDAIERGALGDTGMRVVCAMLDLAAPSSARAIAARAGVTLDQARYALRPRGLLRSTGLVTHHAHGLWAIDPVVKVR